MRRRYNPKLLRSRRSYTIKELAEIYQLHIRTIQDWIKEGLKFIDGSSKPYLFLGENIREFLKVRNQKHKHKLNFGEFYCTKCHNKRRSHPEDISIEITDKYLGKKYKQAFIKGICDICNNKLILFSSDRKIDEYSKQGLFSRELKEVLIENTNYSLNTDIEKRVKYVKSKSQK